MKTSTNQRRAAGAVITGVAAAIVLAGCGQANHSANSIDEVQSAVIQLEAHGTFVSPSGAFEGSGRGSGFIIDPSGIAVTNNHVVTGAGTLEVWIGGDTSSSVTAEVLGVSECLDLAVVKLPGGNYPTLDWSEQEIKPGVEVYSAGFPLGDPNYTLTKGIVSKADVPADSSWASVDHTIEHDARIRPGNSGGPLVDAEGKVVGVNYAYNNETDYNGAIHRDQALGVIEALTEGDVLSLGINGRGVVDDETGAGLGIWVTGVDSGSPADLAGIEPGDVLTRMEGVSLGASGTLAEYCDVLETKGDDAVMSIELVRTGENLVYEGQINGSEPVQARDAVTGGGAGPVQGDTITAIDDTGTMMFQVPAHWSQWETAPQQDESGAPFARIAAAPNISEYENTWAAPGVTVFATPDYANGSTDSVLSLLFGINDAGGCVSAGGDSYEDEIYVGGYDVWGDCGGFGASTIIVQLDAKDASHRAVVVLTAIDEQDFAVIDLVLATLTIRF